MDPLNSTFTLAVIPARWGSTRFPGKPLHKIAGISLVERVWRRVKACQSLDACVIATDDLRILEAVEAFGGKAIMTATSHSTGTDRIAEAIEEYPQATHVINIQGDEPQIEPSLIDELAITLIGDPNLSMVTAANEFTEEALLHDPNVVKVVLRSDGDALYFSRSPLPYQRDKSPALKLYRHKGIYAYRRDFLQHFVTWEPSPLELAESLEQLRALEHKARIRVIITSDTSSGIDTLDQANELEHFLHQSSTSSH